MWDAAMNMKTTLFLLLAAGAVAALFWKGPELAPKLGLSPPLESTPDRGTADTLAGINPASITRVTIDLPGSRPVVFAAGKAGGIELLGNWPTRRQELGELLDTLTHLKSRFLPIPLGTDTDLKPFGLDPSQKPVIVTVDVGTESRVLAFGQEPAVEGENPFVRSSYVRLGGRPELLRLGPDVMPILRRPEDAYRRRQLFPEATERVKIVERTDTRPGNDKQTVNIPTVTILGDLATRIAVTGPAGRFVLERTGSTPKPTSRAGSVGTDPQITAEQLAEAWTVVEPYRDRVDPAKLGAILTAIPELMVEKFEENKFTWLQTGLTEPSLDRFVTAAALAQPSAAGSSFPVSAVFGVGVLLLPEPRMTLTVTLADGSSRELVVGSVSRMTTRVEQSPPMFPGQPPMPNIITEEYRYAKIGSNPLVFEMKDNRLNDIFLSKAPEAKSTLVRELRDPRVVRFDDWAVNRVEIAYTTSKGEPRTIELARTPGDPKAKDEALRKDRWTMVKPVRESIETANVTSLLAALKGMEARGDSIVDRAQIEAVVGGVPDADLKTMGLTNDRVRRITIETDAGKKVILVGTRDAEGKRFVRNADWPQRISRINDAGDSTLENSASAFRAIKLFNSDVSRINSVVVTRPGAGKDAGSAFTLAENESAQWTITAPFTAEVDQTGVRSAISALGTLATQKLFHDPANDEPLKFTPWPEALTSTGLPAPEGDAVTGLTTPQLLITLKFNEPKGAVDIVIEVGNAHSASDYYARVQGTTGVFLVPTSAVKELDQKPESLVDKSLIQFAGRAEVQSISRTMDGQELLIEGEEIVKPMRAKADPEKVEALNKALSRLRAERIEAVAPMDLKQFGLDPPVAKWTVEALVNRKLTTKTVLIGKAPPGAGESGQRFAMAEGSKNVAVLDAAIASQLVAPLSAFRDLAIGGGFKSATKFTVERPDRTITFAKGPKGWRVSEPLDADAEDEDLRELHDLLASLRAAKVVEDNPKDLAKYGLDKPIRWKAYDGAGEVMNLLVGAREKVGPKGDADGDRAYAMLSKGNTLYLLEPRLSAQLGAEYRRRDLWQIPGPDKIREIAITAIDPQNSFTLVQGPKGFTDPARPADMLNAQLVNNLVRTVGTLRAEKFAVDKGADLAKFGLDKPWKLTLTLEDGTKHTLLIGKSVEGKRLYGKVDDPARSDVFIIDEIDSASLDRPRAVYSVVLKKDEPKEKK